MKDAEYFLNHGFIKNEGFYESWLTSDRTYQISKHKLNYFIIFNRHTLQYVDIVFEPSHVVNYFRKLKLKMFL